MANIPHFCECPAMNVTDDPKMMFMSMKKNAICIIFSLEAGNSECRTQQHIMKFDTRFGRQTLMQIHTIGSEHTKSPTSNSSNKHRRQTQRSQRLNQQDENRCMFSFRIMDVKHGLHSSGLPRIGLDVLLVGPSDLCQPFAESLLLHERKTKKKTDVAVEALLSYLEDKQEIQKSRRHVHMIEKIENLGNVIDGQIRMDHVVLVVSQSNVEESKNCIKEAAKYLDDDYALMQRLSIVAIIDKGSEFRNTQWEAFSATIRSSGGKRKRNQKQQPKLFPSPVPVFQYRLFSNREVDGEKNFSSLLAEQAAVSHMILERAKSGIRETPFPSSPLVFTL